MRASASPGARSSAPGDVARASAARRQLLHRPVVAVGIAEIHERSPRQVLNVADLRAPLSQLRMRGVNIGDHHLQTTHGAWRGIRDAFAERNRAGRAGRRQLHEAQRLAHTLIMIRMEPYLLDVERLRAVHIRHWDDHQLKLPVHGAFFPRVMASASGGLGCPGERTGDCPSTSCYSRSIARKWSAPTLPSASPWDTARRIAGIDGADAFAYSGAVK